MVRVGWGHCSGLRQCCVVQGRRKKLREAVLHYYGVDGADDGVIDDELREQCLVLGIDAEQLIPKDQQKEKPSDFELWPEHWTAWHVFLRSQTQWRLSIGMGGAYWQGLDYQAVSLVMQSVVQVPADEQQQVWLQLQILEDEARKHLNKRSK